MHQILRMAGKVNAVIPNVFVVEDHESEVRILKFKMANPICCVKKMSLGESLAGSHAYNRIRDLRRDFLARKVSPIVLPRVSLRVLLRVLPRLSVRLLARLLARLFAPKSLAESLGSDYMHDPRRDSLRDSFFFARGFTKKSMYLTAILDPSFQILRFWVQICNQSPQKPLSKSFQTDF